jgi:gas vesicle protein
VLPYRDYLKKKAINLNSPYYHEAYKKCKNKVTRLIEETKTNYYNTKFENSKNSADSWKTINELLNKKSKTTTLNAISVNNERLLQEIKTLLMNSTNILLPLDQT